MTVPLLSRPKKISPGPLERLKAEFLMRVYRVHDAADDRPPLNLPAYLTPLLLLAAVLLSLLLFRVLNWTLYGMVEDRLEEGFVVAPSLQELEGPLPPDLLGVFELIQRIAPDLDVSSEFAANVMPYIEKEELTESEIVFLDNYRREKFDNDPLWIENNLLFQVLRAPSADDDGRVRFAFGRRELERFLEDLPGLREAKPQAMDFLRVFNFAHATRGPDCGGGADPMCRLRILLVGYRPDPNLFGLLEQVRPETLEGTLYDLNRLSSLFRANQTRIEDTQTLIDALFREVQETAAGPRRALQAINGGIQWVTATAALWCALILLMRRSWAGVQIRLIEGRLLPLLHPGIGDGDGPWRDAAAIRGSLARFGSQVLPLRLVRALRGRTGAEDTSFAETVDRIVEDYRAQVADQEYTVISWLIMLVPTLGFIGTIYGMMLAMGGAHLIVAAESQSALESSVLQLSQHLGTAFDTTLIALVFAALLEWLRGSTQRQEARAFDGLVRQSRIHETRLAGLARDGETGADLMEAGDAQA